MRMMKFLLMLLLQLQPKFWNVLLAKPRAKLHNENHTKLYIIGHDGVDSSFSSSSLNELAVVTTIATSADDDDAANVAQDATQVPNAQ